MTGFIAGGLLAVALAAGTYAALDLGTVTSIERIENPSVNLEGVDHQFPGIPDAS